MKTEFNLTDQERSVLQEISRRTGKTEGALIREAVGRLIDEFQIESRQVLMRKAKGIWKDRSDGPAFEDLRREWDRFQS
ncbi:MAG: CopG family transcriptional regulator [Ferruginibacter sp.]|nr:CopG family transcriptional regulator [Cytophagales bacterium]